MKYPIKLLVFDLDGTLLKTDKTVSEFTLNTLGRCRQSGIKLAYATGRGESDVPDLPAELFDASIVMSGAIASIGDELVYSRLIPYDVARPLLLACDRRGIHIASQTKNMHYSNFNVSEVWERISNFKVVDFSLHEIDAEKLYAVVRSGEDAAFIEKNLPRELYMTVSVDGLGMIMHRDATKSKAVSALAEKWKLSPCEIAAFGDDLIDIDMLKYAGIGVAMENALPMVKAAADAICPGNNEDGVAKWIQSNLLK